MSCDPNHRVTRKDRRISYFKVLVKPDIAPQAEPVGFFPLLMVCQVRFAALAHLMEDRYANLT